MKKYLEFEKLEENETNFFIGGFSQSYVALDEMNNENANNCKGGNCLKGCKTKERKKENSKLRTQYSKPLPQNGGWSPSPMLLKPLFDGGGGGSGALLS